MGVPQEERHLLFGLDQRHDRCRRPGVQQGREQLGQRPGAARVELYLTPPCSARPVATTPEDIVTRLINAEIDGDKPSSEEFELFHPALAVAGNETTRNATAHGMHAPMTHLDQLPCLRAARAADGDRGDPAWASPVLSTSAARPPATMSARDKTIGRRGQGGLCGCVGQPDEDVSRTPTVSDITRAPNDHIAFGGGGVHSASAPTWPA